MRALLLLLAVSGAPIWGLQPVVERTRFGEVQGKWFRTPKNRLVATFLGIPFAEPPVGALRFKGTRPWSKTWSGVRLATKDGPRCPQLDRLGNLVGTEDCLNLNIYVPYSEIGTNAVKSKEKFPVVVYVHGGSFVMGSNNSTRMSPDYVLDHDLILVTVNYRLDFLGFFSTGNGVSPGNYGLKDVIMALKWVQENIHFFGGNASSVTLQGHSAGAAISQLLSLNKKTDGLFHQIIVQSGSALGSWAFHTRSQIRSTSLKLARLAGCDPGDSKEHIDYEDDIMEHYHTEMREIKRDREIVECMRKKDLQTIFNVKWKQIPSMKFGPTLEFDTEDAALTRHPLSSFSEGLFRDIPWLMGVVSDEGVFATIDVAKDENRVYEFIRDFHKKLPFFLEAQEVIRDKETFSNSVAKHFFDNDVGRNLFRNLTQVFSEFGLQWPMTESLKYYKQFSNASGYVYYFAYEGTINEIMQQKYPFHYGVNHGDDMLYQFPHFHNYIDIPFNSPNDRRMINMITEMWANFVRNGVPTSKDAAIWEPYQMRNTIMKIGTEKSPRVFVQEDFLTPRMQFWRDLMSNVSSPLTEPVVTDEPLMRETDSQSGGICVACNYYVITVTVTLLIRWHHWVAT